MTDKLIRGRLLSFERKPQDVHDMTSFSFEEDGALLLRAGKIIGRGDFSKIMQETGDDVEVIDHRPCLIMPGFIDCHAHYPQMQVIASYGAELLEWLNTYTFPEETKFSSPEHGARIASAFLDELIRNGTTTAAVYCTVRPESATALFTQAMQRDMAIISGKVMMDRNAPAALTDTPGSSYEETKQLIEAWHGKGRLAYAITPRFAITSTPEQMEMAQALIGEYPDCYVQTHLSENHAEITYTLELYPDACDYFDVYEKYGLAGSKSLFGHCIHLGERELDAMSDTASVAVFCPTSNLFLGSGLMDWQRYGKRERSVRVAAATDVGGGTNYSMLRTMDEGYKVIALNGEKINPFASFWQITRGNAEAVSMVERIGTLEEGSDADLVVLDACATPAMALRMETVTTLAQELFVLQTLGDDRAIKETYIAGKALKSGMPQPKN